MEFQPCTIVKHFLDIDFHKISDGVQLLVRTLQIERMIFIPYQLWCIGQGFLSKNLNTFYQQKQSIYIFLEIFIVWWKSWGFIWLLDNIMAIRLWIIICRLKLRLIQTKNLKSIVRVLTSGTSCKSKTYMNIYNDVLIIGEKVIVVIGGQLIKRSYFTVVMANHSAKLYYGSHGKLQSS